jgi:ArsR family transcriptional regulator, lead/cadmium/zinc/bismuth-responsive transcriptional repressor
MPGRSVMSDIEERIGDQRTIVKLSRTFSVLADPTRAKIVLALSKAELCVVELSGLLGMSHSAISHQMRPLKDLDLVRCRKEGRKSYYTLSDRHINNLFDEGIKHVLEKI